MNSIPLVPHEIDSLSSIADDYEAVILDLWGVVHDGIQALPSAVDVLERLRVAGTPVCLLSNAPRRASAVAQQLLDLGIDPSLYTYLITSGELTFEHMRATFAIGSTNACFHLGPPFLAGLGDNSGCRMVAELNAADFILCTGTDRVEAIDALLPTLRIAIGLDLPMLCANPDREVMVGDRRVLCAGAIADAYEAMGGSVRSFGKPHCEVYRRALELLSVEACKALAIGDSFATDICGANGAGIDALLVSSGIHHELFRSAESPRDAAAWSALAIRYGARPHFVMDYLRW